MKKKRKGGQRVPVIFRVFNDGGNCIALFPTIGDDYTGETCQSYMQIGQHSGADPNLVMRRSRPATKAERKNLAAELRAMGYRYKIYKRLVPKWRDLRRKQAEKARRQVQQDPAGLPWSPVARAEALQPVEEE